MKVLVRFAVLLLAWTSLGRTVAWAQCAQTNTLDFTATATPTDDWKSHAAVSISGSATTVATGGYTTTATVANVFAVATNGAISTSGKSLVWQQNNQAVTGNKATVTFTFSRPVTNLVLTVADIDKDITFNNFIDKVTFNGYLGTSTTPVTLTAGNFTLGRNAAGTVNQFVSPNALEGTASSDVDNTNGNSTVTFPGPVDKVTLTYENTAGSRKNATTGAEVSRNQTLGILNLSFCAAADVTTTLATTQTAVQGGAAVTYTATVKNNDPANVASGVAPRVQLPAGLTLTTVPTGASYNATTGVLTLPTSSVAAGATVNYPFTFTAPNYPVTITGTASSTATTPDPNAANNDGSAAAAKAATTVTLSCQPSFLDNVNSSSGLTAEYYPETFYALAGFTENAITFFQRTSPQRRNDQALDYTTSTFPVTVQRDGTATNPDHFSARYRGSLSVPVTGSYTFYLTSDDASYLWLDAAALATTPTATNATINNGGGHGSLEKTATVTLTAGLHDVLILYAESGGGNNLKWEYASPDAGLARQVVPASVLCSGPAAADAAPVANNATNTTVDASSAAAVLSPNLSGTDADGNGTLAYYNLLTLPDPNTGTLSLNGTPVAAGQAILVADLNKLFFKPATNFAGKASFTYTVTDAKGRTAQTAATYAIPVQYTQVTANDDSYEVPRNTTVTGNVLLNDSEPNGGALTTTLLASPTNGTVAISARGIYTYTPKADYLGPDSFTYQITNAAGQTATATVNLRVYDTGSACTSSTGRNLLTNPDFSQGNTGFTSDYNYISVAANAALTSGNSRGLNPEGNYAVDVNANTYHNQFQGYDYDNTAADGTAKSATPDAANKFLILNGAAKIQRMYAQTVPVEKNRYYTFSAYFNNMLPPGSNNGLPEVGFVINGASVSSTLVLNESPDRWVKYSSVWYSGDNTTAVFEIRNVSTVAGGNDLGIDQLYFGTCNLPPVANNDLQTTLPNTAKTFSVTANDADGDGAINAATVNLDPSNTTTRQTSFAVANKGTFTVDNSGNVTFAPVSGFTGTVSIPYTVRDNSDALSNLGTISVTVQSPPTDLATTITASTATVTAGQPLTYTVVARNNGPATATNVAETLQLPAGLGAANVTFSNGGAYDNNTGLVIFPTVATLTSGNGTTYGITIKAPGAGPITATAGISGTNTDTDLTNNTATVTTAINPVYDVATTITGPATVVAGNLATYTVTTKNLTTTGALSAAPNVLQAVTLPKGLADVYVSNGGIYDLTTGLVTFPVLAALPLGETAVNTISFAAPASGSFTASATATGSYSAAGTSNNAGDLGTTNNAQNATPTTVTAATGAPATAAADQTGMVANLATTITTPAPSVAPGASVTLSVAVVNNGPSTAANVVEQVSLLPGLTVTGLSTGDSYDTNTGVVTFANVPTLATGATRNYTIQFTAPAAGYVLAAASVSSATTDPIPADNVASTKVMVAPTADVATALAGPASALAGQKVSYTVTTASNGGATANGVVQTVRLPAGLSDVSSTGGGTYDPATGVVTFALGNLPSGSKQVNSISFNAPSAGAYSPTASVSTATKETNVANNQAALTTTIQPSNDVVISVNGPATAPIFGPVTYQVVTTNNGPNTAAAVVPTLQLPANLQNVTLPGDATYNAATGLVTFGTINNLAAGTNSVNSITVQMPEGAQLTGLAQATVSGATVDRNLDNNRASFTTTSTTPNDKTADLSVVLATSATTVTAGQPVTLTATFASVLNNQDPATNVVTTLSLPIGLTGVTVSNGGSYNAATGLVTWPTIASLASPTTATPSSFVYTVTLNAPGIGPLAASAAITSDIFDSAPANNAATRTITITPQTDVTTVVSAPLAVVPGSQVTYSVVTLNNGPSPATNVVQKVTLPAGVTAASITNGGTQSGNVITFPPIASQAAGAAGAVTNTFTITAPMTAYSVTGNVTTTSTESNPNNNAATLNTTVLDLAPLAQNVVNGLQAPEGNSAGPLPISPLAATDDNTAPANLKYAIDPASLPPAAQGVLYYNSGGTTYVALPTSGQPVSLSATQAASLKFDPAAGFVGNAFFSYTATDAVGNVSNAALYTLAVGRDLNSYAKATTPKGGRGNAYQNNDVLTYVIDPNGVRYAAAGVYNAATGALVAGASNGLPTTGTNATMAAADVTRLAAVGVALNAATGQLYVVDRTKLTPSTYSVTVTTTDVNGGTNAVQQSFTIGANPLPVELTDFAVKAVRTDALLTWRTASEKNNDHFAVERSFDGRTFGVVGRVAGHGTSSQAHDYRLTDFGVGARYQGTVYYRIRQVDADSTAQHSPVRTVAFTAEVAATVVLYPNPAAATTTLDLTALPAGAYQVTLLDMTGRPVLTTTLAGGRPHALAIDSLPAGSYVVLVRGAGATYTARLVKK